MGNRRAYCPYGSTLSFYLRDSATFAALHLRYPLPGFSRATSIPGPYPHSGRLRVSLLRQAHAIFPGISFAVIQLLYYLITIGSSCQSRKARRGKRLSALELGFAPGRDKRPSSIRLRSRQGEPSSRPAPVSAAPLRFSRPYARYGRARIPRALCRRRHSAICQTGPRQYKGIGV